MPLLQCEEKWYEKKVPFFLEFSLYILKYEITSLLSNLCQYMYTGIFFAILGRGPRAFQIGKISAVKHYFGKFSKQTRTSFLVSLKTK